MRCAWPAVLLLAGCTEPVLQTPAPSVLTEPAAPEETHADASLTDEDCVGCHVDDARHWQASAHASAFTNETFQAEWQPHRQAACVRCHAPLAEPEAPQGNAALNGISCVVCHVREGSVLAAQASPEAPHPITVETALSTSQACAGCHDFTFAAVAPTPYDEAEMLQGTLREWHAVEGRGTCQRCHMPEADHAMPGARDASLLMRALHVEANAHTVGQHTEAWPMTRETEHVSATLMRRFAREGDLMHQVSDDRVPANAPRVVTLTLPRARRVAWRVTWQALDPNVARARWIPADDAARVMAEGEIEAQ